MIKIENMDIFGFESAVRGMRNPMNSWDKSDSIFGCSEKLDTKCLNPNGYLLCENCPRLFIGNNDLELMKKLVSSGTDHSKFMRMIHVQTDVTAPLYWWKEYDTYKVGTVADSCSTMHKIMENEFTVEDFSTEHLVDESLNIIKGLVDILNLWRKAYLNGMIGKDKPIPPKDKKVWWQVIQLLPSSYNQRRTIDLNYQVLRNIYHSRKEHKLDEWRDFCMWIEHLPYSELITD